MKAPSDAPPAGAPRVSANELAAYVFESPSGRVRKLKEQKFGDEKRSYYTRALNGVLASFLPNTGTFELDIVKAAEKRIRGVPAETKKQADRLSSNAEMLQHFAVICGKVKRPPGLQEVVRKNALFALGSVMVSVRPEIITKTSKQVIALTKFRFSKHPFAADSSEILLLILMRYGRSALANMGALDLEHTCLVDCYSKNIVFGHGLPNLRERQLDDAVRQVERIWPQLTPQSKTGDFF